MSPTSSTRKVGGGHSRRSSLAEVVSHADRPASPSKPAPMSSLPASTSAQPVKYTVFVRLPFRRDEFEDPPPVEWDASKDAALWKIIAKASSKDLDWDEISTRFQVTLPFLLQQAAYLYDRHFEAMRGMVNRLGAGGGAASGTGSKAQVDAAASGGAAGMQRTGSRDSKAATSSVATALPRNRSQTIIANPDSGLASGQGIGRAGAPPISRTPSSATVTQSRVITSPTVIQQRSVRTFSGSGRRPPYTAATSEAARDGAPEHAIAPDDDSAPDSEEETPILARSRFAHRPPPHRRQKPPTVVSSDADEDDDDDDDDEDSNGSFLPFATHTNPREDPSATLREPSDRRITRPSKPDATRPKAPPEDDHSENTATSSASSMSRHFSSDGGLEQRPIPGPISPRHRAHLASLSPRSRTQGSEGSPSMGSSFSDLDDISQSALDEAVLSNMRQGGSSMASRMSTLRDALGRRG